MNLNHKINGHTNFIYRCQRKENNMTDRVAASVFVAYSPSCCRHNIILIFIDCFERLFRAAVGKRPPRPLSIIRSGFRVLKAKGKRVFFLRARLEETICFKLLVCTAGRSMGQR